ncbi:MAG: cytochrome c peroxidase [Thiomonas sp.]|uniref:cytochrome-c peroxidase n=1 Tax=Thiomonas sp. TaxID=2047785 RepID=UPI002A35970A|nr:cytochrome c peroxidase [Thiomonas sp.]MDY0329343.1 cytochrome c peroxidase [Thiomonas sp.]
MSTGPSTPAVASRPAPQARPRTPGRPRWRRRLVTALVILIAGSGAALAWGMHEQPSIAPIVWLLHPVQSFTYALGGNPHPVQFVLPPQQPLSAVALLGRQLFFDKALSASGKMSCASCHDPAYGYNPPPGSGPVMHGGPERLSPGFRPPPSLAYLYRQQAFSIGPDNDENETITLQQLVTLSKNAKRATKTAQSTAQAGQNLVPAGGLFWDGRVDTLQQQAGGPLFNPVEMDAGTPQRVAGIIEHQPYAKDFLQLFGPNVFEDPKQTVAEALFAIARYQIEDPKFHAFNSQFDAWLQGKARLTPQQMRGYLAFNDVHKGDCAACHLDQPTQDHLPPLFTDTQYEALGVPRNPHIPANHNPHYFDLGICGPFRTDLKNQTQYCGMFLTPTLRNVAQRPVYFHNGVYHSLKQVLDFYNFRDVQPGKIYPTVDGKVQKYDDLPPQYHANVDVTDPPLNRHLGEKPAMSAQDMRDIIAFLHTLNDGYTPLKPAS